VSGLLIFLSEAFEFLRGQHNSVVFHLLIVHPPLQLFVELLKFSVTLTDDTNRQPFAINDKRIVGCWLIVLGYHFGYRFWLEANFRQNRCLSLE
jgi:hypothetical protein